MQARSFEAGSAADNATGDILNVSIITARSRFICSSQARNTFMHQQSTKDQVSTNRPENGQEGVNICVS